MLCSILWSRTEIGFPVSLKRVYEWPGREITESHLTLLMPVGRVSKSALWKIFVRSGENEGESRPSEEVSLLIVSNQPP